MRRSYTLWLTFLALLCLPLMTAWAQLDYYFEQGSGEPISMDGSTQLFRGTQFNGRMDSKYFVNLPFSFKFDGVMYSQVTVSMNGVIYFGSTSPGDATNNLRGAGSYPLLAPYWDHIRFGGGAGGCATPLLHYVVKGAAPNRIFAVEYLDVTVVEPSVIWNTGWGNPLGTFQVRLYEGSNKIEFWYGSMSNCDKCGFSTTCYPTSASIGIAASPSRFISVSYASGFPQGSNSVADDAVSLEGGTITRNTLFTFAECSTVLNGRIGPGNGGTPMMANGDTLFRGFTTQVGQTSIFKPFDIRMAAVNCASSYTLTITGPAAADYYFGTPGTQTSTGSLSNGSFQVPEITFKPTTSGAREATLTVQGVGLNRSFKLLAYAPFVNYIGHVDEGGTTLMTSGDALLVGQRVDRRSSDTYQPFTLVNVSSVAVPVTYTITGGFGQYSITPGGSLGAGASTRPTITFNALGFGPQVATLEVNAGGEIRTFTLNAISAAPGGIFRISGSTVDTSSSLFNNVYTCAGESRTIPIEMVNTGYGTFTINGAEFYRVDTTYRQGIPKYEFLRDANGNLIPTGDYVLTLQPPAPGNPGTFQPFTLAEGESRTLYLTFNAQYPGKRYSRVYFRTNSENTAAPDTNGAVREGLLSFEVYGRGFGSHLSDRPEGGLPRAVVFPSVKLGQSSQAVLRIMNPGQCSLRVSVPKLALTAGDVDEFSIVRMPSKYIDPATGDLVLAPGESDSVVLRFAPRQAGSRRAGLRLVTNDSTIQIPGITERGVYYVDLFGGGGTDLYAQGITFAPALIGGGGSDQQRGVVRIVNTQSVPVTIGSIEIEGVDAGEFGKEGWPTLPVTLQPGQELELDVVFAPVAGGNAGSREAEVTFTTSSGVQIKASLTGEAGTRRAMANPTAVNFPVTTTGKYQRRTVSIANDGTMPVTLTNVEVIGPDAANFQLGRMERMELAPGTTEYIEVTYVPTAPGTVSATLEFSGNMTNGPVQVQLGGTSVKSKKQDNDPSVTLPGRQDVIEDGVGSADGLEELSTSGVTGEAAAGGMTLSQSVPNPAQHTVEIRYGLTRPLQVELALYDAGGRLVRLLDAGTRPAGQQVVRVDVSDLPSGGYFYRLSSNGHTLSRTMSIVR